jgi:hypothetical protein
MHPKVRLLLRDWSDTFAEGDSVANPGRPREVRAARHTPRGGMRNWGGRHER